MATYFIHAVNKTDSKLILYYNIKRKSWILKEDKKNLNV